MSTLTLTKEAALEAFGKFLDQVIEVKKQPSTKTWKETTSWEACAEHEGIDPLSSYYNTEDKAESAARKIKRMTKVVNRLKNGRDWVANYADGNQRKYTPYFVWDKDLNGGSGGFRFSFSDDGCVSAVAGSGSAFCFSDLESSDFAGKAWLHLYIACTF